MLFAIRPFVETDLPALAELYAHTVRILGPSLYSEDQVAAWARYADETESFRNFVMHCQTYVADAGECPIGFAGIADDGHVVSLYVHGDYTRKGVGGALLEAVADHARTHGIPRMYTEASHFSRALFERHGFRVVEEETVVRNGVPFHRFKMARLTAGAR